VLWTPLSSSLPYYRYSIDTLILLTLPYVIFIPILLKAKLVEILQVTLESPRELRGLEILSKGKQIQRLSENTYRVRSSQTNGNSYLVTREGKEWTCECPDYINRKVVCKHIYSVYFSLNLRHDVVTRVQPTIDLASSAKKNDACRNCGSLNVVKIGLRHNQHFEAQRFLCKDCNHKFSDNEEGFEKIKATPKAITSAVDCYFKGMS